jgi:D-arabinose 1-dehydrogenase-like Zn-dependent alcohol dehydrogenase
LTPVPLFSEKDKKSNIENNLDTQRRIYDNKSRSRNNALRHSGAFPGDLVAVLGVGGLGHLGIQFANKSAIGRGSENATLAKKLGAALYIASKSANATEALQKLGGAQVILATAPSSKAMSELIDGLAPNGTPADSEDTLRFAELTGVPPMIETYPLEKAAEAYARMMSGHAEFRVVLTM